MKEAKYLCNNTLFPESKARRDKIEKELYISKNCSIQYTPYKQPPVEYTLVLIVLSTVFTLLVSALLCVFFKRAKIKLLFLQKKEKGRQIKKG